MIHEIKFLSQQTKIASNHLFSKQLKTSNRTNRLEVSFLSFIQVSQVWFKYGRPRSPRSSTPFQGVWGKTFSCNYSYIIGSAKPPD